MKNKGITSSMASWSAETRQYNDLDELHPPSQVPIDTPGEPGSLYSSCSVSPSQTPRLTLAVQVGMNAKAARKLVATMAAHPGNIPLSLFVYGDFVELFPDLVRDWARNFTIGMRENQPFPLGHFILQKYRWIRYSLVSAIERHRDAGLHPAYYLPDNVTDTIIQASKSRGLRLVQPTARFPPTEGRCALLTAENYYSYRDVERVPKAERIITEQLGDRGGILCLDSDHPDSYMISVFLLDYLVQKSNYEILSMDKCISG
ncbi:Hypp3054 [Branchiostoma lanceolatum]|uniref:Hypp3054 protein n=1 Tax=Branchiostoma lanceolatum TaxID=7740 RepID=A0A8J9ZZF6_BRALA|nr:Hypp3054 [Branchiostoma lanceolatum]